VLSNPNKQNNSRTSLLSTFSQQKRNRPAKRKLHRD